MTAQSSKALFRAMRPKLDRGPALINDIPTQRAPTATRRERDAYLTGEPEAIRALLAPEGDRIRRCGMVWEPAVGNSDLAREIEAFGFPVRGGDIHQGSWSGITCLGSFYDTDTAAAPAIITNPPYSEINARDGAGRWLRHILAMPGWSYCALLLSWDWPAAAMNGHAAMLDRDPFSYCYLMRWKLDFTGEGSPPQRNAWFVWDREDLRHPGLHAKGISEPGFRWLNKSDARQSEFDI